jgi:flagellar basal body-associated protein FliL
MAAATKKGNKGLMIGLVLLVVIIAAGAVFGLAMTGKINIPGITPKKKPTPVAAPKPKPKIEPKKEDPVVDANMPEKVQSPESIKQGAVKLAEVWNEMPSEKLTKVVAKWTQPRLLIYSGQ